MTKTATTFTARDADGTWELELIQKSSDGWQYGRVISTEEAVEILNNVRRLADVLVRAEREGNQ